MDDEMTLEQMIRGLQEMEDKFIMLPGITYLTKLGAKQVIGNVIEALTKGGE